MYNRSHSFALAQPLKPGNPPLIESIENNFASLVKALKELDAVRKQVSGRHDSSDQLMAACESYCSASKRVLRSTIQSVDRIVEEHAQYQSRTPLKPFGNQQSPIPSQLPFQVPPERAVHLVVRARELIAMQRALDYWKMYLMSQRMRRSVDRRQTEMLTHLDSAQKLAEVAKTEVHMVEFKDGQMSEELARLRNDKAALQNQTSRLGAQIDEMKHEMQKLANDNESARAANKRLLDSARSRSLSVSSNGESEKLKQVQSDVRLLTDKLQRSEETGEKLTDELRRVRLDHETEKASLIKKLDDVALEKKQVQISLDQRTASEEWGLRQRDDRIETLLGTVAEKERKLKALETERDTVKRADSSGKKELLELESQVSKLNVSLNKAKLEIDHLDSELKQANSQIADKEKSVSLLKKGAASDLKRFEEAVSELEETRRLETTSREKAEKLEAKLASVMSAAAQNEARLALLPVLQADKEKGESELKAKNELLDRMGQQIEEFKKRDSEKEQVVVDLIGRNNTLLVELDQAKSARPNAKLEETIAQLKLQKEKLEETLEIDRKRLSESVSERDKRSQELEIKIVELAKVQAEMRADRLAADNTGNQLARVQAQLEQSREEVGRLKEQKNSLVLQLEASASTEYERLYLEAREEKTALSLELNAVLKQQARPAPELERLYKESRDEISKLQEEKRELERVAKQVALKEEIERTLTAQVDMLSKDLDAAENEIEELRAPSLAEEELRARVEEVEVAYEEMAKQLEEREQEIADKEKIEAELGLVSAENENLAQEVILLKLEIGKLDSAGQQRVKAVQAELSEARGQVEKLQIDLHRAEREVQVSEKEKKALEERLARNVEREISQTTDSTADDLRKQLAKSDREIARLQAELDILSRDLHRASLELDMSEKEVRTQAETLKKLTEAAQELDRMRDDKKVLEENQAHQLVLLESLRTEIALLKKDKSNLVANLDKLSGSGGGDEDLKQKLEKSELDLSKLQSDFDILAGDLEQAERELDQAETRLAEKSESIKELSGAVEALKRSAQELGIEKEVLEKQRAHQSELLEAKESENALLRQKKSELEAQLQVDDDSGARRDSVVVEDLKEQLEKSELDLEKLRSDFDIISGDLLQAEKELVEKSEENALFKKSAEELERVRIEKRVLEEQQSYQLDRLEAKEAEIALLKKDKSDLLDKLQAQSGTPDSVVEALRQDISQSESERSKLQSELEIVAGDLEQAEKELDQFEKEVADKSARITELANEILALKNSAQEHERVRKEKMLLEERLAQQSSHLDSKVSDMSAVQRQIQDQFELISKLQTENAQKVTIEAEKDKLSLQIKHMQQELVSAESRLGTLNAEIETERTLTRDLKARLAIQSSERILRVVSRVAPVETFGASNDQVVAVLQSALKQAEERQAVLLEERVKLESRQVADGDLAKTIKNLADEKSSLTDQLGRVERMLTKSVLLDTDHHPIGFIPLSEFVTVDEGGLVATYVGANKDADMCGCLMTNRALPLFEEGLYFEVRINGTSSGNPDGLTVGITTSAPWQGAPVPNTLDDVAHSWALGYNGQSWNSAKSEWKEIAWSGKDLTVGQRVGVFVAVPPVSQLFIFVDDALVCKGPARLPSCLDVPFFGLVDLLGNCESVSLLWGAKPPPSALGLVPVDPPVNVAVQFKLPTRRATLVLPPEGPPSLNNSSVQVSPTSSINSPKKPRLPKLFLKPTLEPILPVRPPSSDSEPPSSRGQYTN